MFIRIHSVFITLLLFVSSPLISQNFITVWDLSKNGITSNAISIGGSSSGSVNYRWKEISPGNDSGSGSFVSNQLLFTGLPSNAIIRLEIEPTNFLNISINNSDDKDRLIDIEQWGTTTWTSMNRAFYGCRNLQISATDIPDLSLVTDMSNMFRDCEKINSPTNINSWNTSNVKNMSYLFTNAYEFNQNISYWNTSQVTNFSYMFLGAFKFNQDIGNWNTSNAINMSNMFVLANEFNQNLGSWDVSNVTNMLGMFKNTMKFNNGDVNTIKNWNVSSARDMQQMFFQAVSFNQNIGSWALNSGGVDLRNMLDNSGINCINYSNTIIGWNTNSNTPSNVFLGANGISFASNAFQDRANLQLSTNNGGKGWVINDAGLTKEFCGNFVTQWNLATSGSGNTKLSIGLSTSDSSFFNWQEISPGNAQGSGQWRGDLLTIENLPSGALIRLQIETINLLSININNGVDRNRLILLENWGNAAWTSMETAFKGCKNMTITASDIPNLSFVESMYQMFFDCSSTYEVPNIQIWQTQNLKNMSGLFQNAVNLTAKIEKWNTSNVTDMSFMLSKAKGVFIGGNWNTSKVINMSGMFLGSVNFNQNIGNWNTSKVTDMSRMFEGTQQFNQNISNWNTSEVIDMSGMFENSIQFNQNIGNWNTSKVTNMSRMFKNTQLFNQNISNWNTSSVTNMSEMFNGSKVFDQGIGNWNTSKVTDMSYMFNSSKFNQDIGVWDVSNVMNMSYMFSNSIFNQTISNWNTSKVNNMNSMFSNSIFNQEIGAWNTSKVITMKNMFSESFFNKDISRWNISNVTDLSGMFRVATRFNQYIGQWNTSKVTDMSFLFHNALQFNQDLSFWKTDNVTDMTNMFIYANSFNQDLSTWNTSKVTKMYQMFQGASSFNQSLENWTLNPLVDMQEMLSNSGLDCKNYSSTLIGWNQNPLTPNGIKLGSIGLLYGPSALEAINNLRTSKNWVINGGNLVDSFYCEKMFANLKQPEKNKISIFPNPSSTILNIKTDEEIHSIIIYDAFGKLIKTENQKSFSISEFQNGLYLIEVKTEKNTLILKFNKL